MKRLSLAAAVAASLFASSASIAEDAPKAPEANQSNVSYSLGMMIGSRLKGEFSDIDLDRFKEGVAAMLKG